MAGWVRFADAKATILTAGLGVVLTLLMTNARTITRAIEKGCPAICVVGGLTAVAVASFLYTLCWLVRAIGPQTSVTYSGLNRFAWPTLAKTTPDQLIGHTNTVDVQTDAWRQAIDLSILADRKFKASGHAIKGFGVLIVLGAATIATAIGFTT